MEADLARYYHLDAMDLLRGRMSARKALLLLTALPAESAFISAIAPSLDATVGDGPERLWSTTDQLLASVLDAVREMSWILASVNSKGKVRRPEPLPRPGPKPDPTKVRRLSPEARAKLDRWNLGGRADDG